MNLHCVFLPAKQHVPDGVPTGHVRGHPTPAPALVPPHTTPEPRLLLPATPGTWWVNSTLAHSHVDLMTVTDTSGDSCWHFVIIADMSFDSCGHVWWHLLTYLMTVVDTSGDTCWNVWGQLLAYLVTVADVLWYLLTCQMTLTNLVTFADMTDDSCWHVWWQLLTHLMFANAAYITIYSVVFLVNSSDDIHSSTVKCRRTMFWMSHNI